MYSLVRGDDNLNVIYIWSILLIRFQIYVDKALGSDEIWYTIITWYIYKSMSTQAFIRLEPFLLPKGCLHLIFLQKGKSKVWQEGCIIAYFIIVGFFYPSFLLIFSFFFFFFLLYLFLTIFYFFFYKWREDILNLRNVIDCIFKNSYLMHNKWIKMFFYALFQAIY